MKGDKPSSMMEQYRVLKKQHQDKVLFFRLGDFYEMFDDDAKEVSSLLKLTLTKRVDSPMCGIPVRSVTLYINKLLNLGKTVAICEQVEEANAKKGLIERKITQIVTPGTFLDDDFLGENDSNKICSLVEVKSRWALCFCEFSTGEYNLYSFDSFDDCFESILNQKTNIKEILIEENCYFSNSLVKEKINSLKVSVIPMPQRWFSGLDAIKIIKEKLKAETNQVGLNKGDISLCAVGGIFHYYESLNILDKTIINKIQNEDIKDYLILDDEVIKSLELFVSIRGKQEDASLFSVINKTLTTGGKRLLSDLLKKPLRSIKAIEERQEEVEILVNNPQTLYAIREQLSNMFDLQRLSVQIWENGLKPNLFIKIKQTIDCFSKILASNYFDLSKKLLTDEIVLAADSLLKLSAFIEGALEIDPSGIVHIKKGFSKELDEAERVLKYGEKFLLDLTEKYKKELGFSILNLNKSGPYGYTMEVPKTGWDKVPSTWILKQNLLNKNRYTTFEFMSEEAKLLNAEENYERIEKQVWNNIIETVRGKSSELSTLGSFISWIDVYSSLSLVASKNNWAKPSFVNTKRVLNIIDARHPVVEALNPQDNFIPNSISFDNEKTFAFITGPNMAGKSTYLRQNALVIILSQLGSFVPAKKVTLSLFDRIFCRIGASDDISKGESTFYIEMLESALILKSASRNSFVIMDEVGRGTAAKEGEAIAYAIADYLVNKGIMSLFATHYSTLWNELGKMKNTIALNPTVERKDNKIIFRRKIKEGVASSSYAIDVAIMAGLPPCVIDNAKAYYKDFLNSQNNLVEGSLFENDFGDNKKSEIPTEYIELVEKIKNYDINSKTPIESLNFIDSLKRLLK